MSSAKITTIGFENYLSGNNESLFDYLSLPSGIDKDTLVGSILMRAGEFEVLYSDPYIMRDMIGLWSKKHYMTFDKWIKALNISYDPLNNYDRTEEYTDTHKGSSNGGSSGNNTSENTRTDDLTMENDLTRTDDLASTNDTTVTGSVSADNVSTFSNADQQVTDQDTTNTGTVTDTGTVTNTGTVTDEGGGTFTENHNDSDEWTNIHKARLFGNIGVTTSQQMLLSELNEAAPWNIYEHISDLFVSEFCILVY